MRTCKKEYYTKQLDNNIKGMWNILNNIIKNNTRQATYPQYCHAVGAGRRTGGFQRAPI